MNNTDTLSLLQCLLIASWYLGFLAADVAPAAGQGSGSIPSGASGFFPLKLRDYAPEYFQTPGSDSGKVILALRTVERWVGEEAQVLRNAYLSNSLPPTQRDFLGYNVSYEVLNVSHSTPAQTFTDGRPGPGGLQSPSNRSQTLEAYCSIDIAYQVFWTIYSSYREEAQHFNATIVQQNFIEKFRELKGIRIWENWYLRTDIYPQAAPIIAHLPLGYAQGFTIAVQLTGALLVPFVVEMETLFLTALFRPLDEQLFISQLAVIQVSQSAGAVDLVNVTMSGVFGSPMTDVAQVFSSVLCNSSCSQASGSRFAATFLRENLTLTTAHLLSVKPDGSSLQAQAAAMGFPSVQQSSATMAASYLPLTNDVLGPAVGSIVGFCSFAALTIGLIYWLVQRRRHRARTDGAKDALMSQELSPRTSRTSEATQGSTATVASRQASGSGGGSFKDMQKWSVPSVCAEDIEICRHADGAPVELGRGGFCRVLKGVHGGIREVALKMLLDVKNPHRKLENFTKELELLKTLNFDSRIVQLYGACILEGCPVLVLEFMAGGDLSAAMSDDKSGCLKWYSKGQHIAMDVVRGLAYLHKCKCLHGDLTCRNILLNEDRSVAKIGDLGLSKMVQSTITELALGGTLAFAAPEVLLNMRCNEKADMFSFAVVLWTICTQEVPIRGHLRTLRVPEECPVAIAQLIDDCLENPPKERPTARQAHDIIKRCLTSLPSSPPQEGLDATALNAAAEHCRGLLGGEGVQQGAIMPKDCTQPSSEGVSKRWQSVAGCGLSSLAPHDLHAERAVTRIMPRDLSSSSSGVLTARPNPFDQHCDFDSSLMHSRGVLVPERPISHSSISKPSLSVTAKGDAHPSSSDSPGLRGINIGTCEPSSEQGGSSSGVAPS